MLDQLAGAFVDHGAEAGKHFEFEELRVFEPQASEAPQDRRLGLAADPRTLLPTSTAGFWSS